METDKSQKKILFLIGLGLCDEKDLPIRSIDALKTCDAIFMEDYTNLIREDTKERLEKMLSKKIISLSREDVEGERIILESAKKQNTALIVPGDPLSATTHNSLISSAKENSIKTKVFHASSIFSSAPAAAGLQNYKFAKTATITFWRKNFEPDSFIDLIENNQKINAHTLCLLDIDRELGSMRPKKALEILFEAQRRKMERKELGAQIISRDTKIFIVSHVGWEDEKVWTGKISEYNDELEGPAVIIIPSKLHFMEGV